MSPSKLKSKFGWRISKNPGSVYIKLLGESYHQESGSHLLSHVVSNIVPSAAQVLTIVFGMRTGVTPERIATGKCALALSKYRSVTLAQKNARILLERGTEMYAANAASPRKLCFRGILLSSLTKQ